MAYTTQIAALQAALAKGVLTVTVEGKSTTYRSVSDLIAALRYFESKESSGNSPASAIGVVKLKG